jgi:hypothetical protein
MFATSATGESACIVTVGVWATSNPLIAVDINTTLQQTTRTRTRIASPSQSKAALEWRLSHLSVLKLFG